MKSQLDDLMRARGLSAILVTGGEGYSEARDYLSNGAHITGGNIVKKIGSDPVLIVNGMETEEAKKSGYPVIAQNDLDFYSLTLAHDPATASVLFWGKCLEAIGISSGKVGIYGRGDLSVYLQYFRLSETLLPQYEFVGEAEKSIFTEAFLTKDSEEIERLRSVAERTNAVVALTWDFIASHRATEDETVVNADGEALTIGAVKQFVRAELMKVGLEDTDMIFAQGRDGGFPHSRGESDMALKLGQPIVFDIFPRELGGGYHHDMTRTWCIGYAPPEVQAIYNDVMQAFDISVESFGVGKPTALVQDAVLDFFESKGHPTSRINARLQEGYMHSIGHGLGLLIHERPWMSHVRREDIFQVGNAITIEPGLYYPDKGMGCRIEDTMIVTEEGELISITPFKKDLVLPLQG